MLYIDSPTSSIVVSKSDDGVTYETVTILAHTSNPAWYVLDGVSDTTFVKLSNSTALTITDVRWISSYRDVPIYRLNRNDYMALPNKSSKGTPLQFWFDRQTDPVISLWNAPNSTASQNLIQYVRQRQISDVGDLNETLEMPQRWLEAITWLLAVNTATETPGVAPERVTLCGTMAQNALAQVQIEERDNSPVNFSPNIGVYTR
jgi:hypothetical protein